MAESRIRVLPEHLANQIAAGEVVQRPSSVVKELIENSLDAGAGDLLVAVEEGGKNLVRVSDNGEGMSEEDALLSLKRHATSKLGSVEDLENIRTYGFRGEALPSIASVSHLTITTRRNGDDVATVVRCAGGDVGEISRAPRDVGTTIDVRNLFYNVPGRRKFLRSRTTEFRHVYDVVQRSALSRPDVRLKFLNDGVTVFDLQPGTLEVRMTDVLGEVEMEGAIPVNERNDLISVVGYIGKPGFSRKSRTQQLLFLNRRPVQSRTLNHAVFSAYEHFLVKNSYPFFLLLLEVDPRKVDVNVHPAKLEVKLEDEQGVYRFIHSLTRKALASSGSIPAVSAFPSDDADDVRLRFTDREHRWFPRGRESFPGDVLAASLLSGEGTAGAQIAKGMPDIRDDHSPSSPTRPAEWTTPGEIETAPVWQVHTKYILLQVEGGLMLVDQHVAHERILYERILRRFESGKGECQQLLFPSTIQLNAADTLLLTDLLPILKSIGFEIRPFGKHTFLLEGVPPEVKDGNEPDIIGKILWSYREEGKEPDVDSREVLAKSYSCRAAVKAGDPLKETEMRVLVRELFETKMPLVCPHGRPTVFRLSLDELDRRFGRK